MAEQGCSAGTAPGLTLGLHTDMAYFSPGADQEALADATRQVGAGVARTSLLWDLVEPVRGVRDWRVVDSLVAELEARGIAPLFTVVGSPPWASGADPRAREARFQVPRDPGKFAAWVDHYAGFVDEAARRYAGRVKKWELWNEPNEHFAWNPGPDVAQYTAWARRMQAVIAARVPDAEIAVGALAGLTQTSPGDITGIAFLDALYKAGLAPDIVSIHPYALANQAPDATLPFENNFTDIAAIRKVMLRHGQGGAKIWVTEWGWPAKAVGEQAQAAHLDRSLHMLASLYPYVTLAVYFLVRDTGDFTHGLFAADGRMKPAAEVFRRFGGSLSPPAAPDRCEQGFLLPGEDGFGYAETGPVWRDRAMAALDLPPWALAPPGVTPPEMTLTGIILPDPGAGHPFLAALLPPP